MNKFVKAVAEVLEVEALTLDAHFREVEGWCSLRAFGLMVLMENDWGAPMTVERFLRFETVRDLYREVFLQFAAKVLKVSREKITGTLKYGEIPEWDSVSHLRLVMESERKFGSVFPLERIPAISTLDDFLV